MGSLYRRHRFPPEIVSHAVWLYHRFTLSFRDVEDLLAERDITVPTKPFASGVGSLDQHMPVLCGDDKVDSATLARGRVVHHHPWTTPLSLESG